MYIVFYFLYKNFDYDVLIFTIIPLLLLSDLLDAVQDIRDKLKDE